MSGEYVDLHCHYLPGVDDGVRSVEEGLALCRGLARLGYRKVVATPHIRTAMFDNDRAGLTRAHAAFRQAVAGAEGVPELGLAAEHFYDDVVWGLFARGEALPYPGGHAVLFELSPERVPLGLPERCFELRVRGVRIVIAHPERYPSLFRSSDPLGKTLEVGALAQLDLMSLVGQYGRAPQRTAERMLREDVYTLACSDCHRPEHVEVVERALARLVELTNETRAHELLATKPADVLEGRIP